METTFGAVAPRFGSLGDVDISRSERVAMLRKARVHTRDGSVVVTNQRGRNLTQVHPSDPVELIHEFDVEPGPDGELRLRAAVEGRVRSVERPPPPEAVVGYFDPTGPGGFVALIRDMYRTLPTAARCVRSASCRRPTPTPTCWLRTTSSTPTAHRIRR